MAIAMLVLLAGCSGSTAPVPASPGVKVMGNPVCPVSGNAVGGSAQNPHFHSDFKEFRIGFMCPTCKGTFDESSDEQKLLFLNKALAGVNKPPVKP